MEIFEDNLFPITWEESEFLDIITISYSNVEFIEDFGIFKKGDEIPYLLANIESGILYEVDERGEEIERQPFKCVASN